MRNFYRLEVNISDSDNEGLQKENHLIRQWLVPLSTSQLPRMTCESAPGELQEISKDSLCFLFSFKHAHGAG